MFPLYSSMLIALSLFNNICHNIRIGDLAWLSTRQAPTKWQSNLNFYRSDYGLQYHNASCNGGPPIMFHILDHCFVFIFSYFIFQYYLVFSRSESNISFFSVILLKNLIKSCALYIHHLQVQTSKQVLQKVLNLFRIWWALQKN